MTKIVLTGDIHLGYPNRLDDILSSLKAIRTYMNRQSINKCFILGDLFHTRQSIATDVMHKAYEFFEETKKTFNQSWAVFPGNHDMFMKNSWKIHSLKMLSTVLEVYDKACTVTIDDHKFWILPYIHDESIYMKAATKIGSQATGNETLLTHIGVCGASLNECFLHKNWSVVSFDQYPINVYAGHFHCTQQVGKLWYPGSPLPFTYAEGLVAHGFFVYDLETQSHEFIKLFDIISKEERPSDFITISDTKIETLSEEDINGNMIRVSLNREYTHHERAEIREKMLKAGAKDVSWMKIKPVELDASGVSAEGINLSKPEELLKTYYELDKPEHLTLEMLLKYNKEIIKIGNEKLLEAGEETSEEI